MTRFRLRHLTVLVGLALTPALAQAQGEPRTHTVKKGDTLWDLAQQYLGDPFKWPEIYRRNQTTIQDPNLIYPDQVIIISGDVPVTPGTPADSTAGGGAGGTDSTRVGEAGDSAVVMDSTGAQVPAPRPPSTTIFAPVRLREANRGERQSIRVQERAAAVRVGDFQQAPYMWDAAGVAGAGRLVDATSGESSSILGAKRAIQYMEAVVVELPQGAAGQAGDRFLVFRSGPAVAGQGLVIVPTGIIRLTGAAANGRAPGVLLEKFEDVYAGHALAPLDTLAIPPGAYPSRVEFGLATKVSYVHGGPVLPSLGHQVILAAKASDGLVPGDQLTISVPGATAVDGTPLPPRDIAVLQVVRVTAWGASAIIIAQDDAGVTAGVAARVTGKMP